LRTDARFLYKGTGMSEITLCQKLGIKQDRRVLVLDPPAGFVRRLDPLPEGVGVTTKIVSLADVIVLFLLLPGGASGSCFPKANTCLRRAARSGWPGLARARASSPIWTSSSSGRWGWPAGLTDNKVIAVDEILVGAPVVEKQRDRLPLPRTAEMSAPDA